MEPDLLFLPDRYTAFAREIDIRTRPAKSSATLRRFSDKELNDEGSSVIVHEDNLRYGFFFAS